MNPRLALGALLAGHALSRTGNTVAAFAVPFLVLARGGSALDVGVAAFAATIPVVIGGPLGGIVVDRFGALRTGLLADIVSGATIVLIPLLSLADALPFWLLLVLLCAGGLLDVPGETARQVVLPSYAQAAGVRMEQAVGFTDATTRLATLLGAPLAGVLVATVGAAPTFFVTAGTFALSALLTVVLLPGPRITAGEPASVWADLTAGLRFIVREPVLRAGIALVLVTNLLDAARGGTLMPLYATEHLGGAAALGVISGCFGGAALVGSLLFGLIAHRVPRRPVIVLGFLGACVPAWLGPALGADVGWLIAAAVFSGLCAGSLNPTLGAIMLERVPEQVRGRVYGAISAGTWAGIPLGGLLGGAAAGLVGLQQTFAVMLGVYVLVALTPLLGGPWRRLDETKAR